MNSLEAWQRHMAFVQLSHADQITFHSPVTNMSPAYATIRSNQFLIAKINDAMLRMIKIQLF
jgi:hypothetical protein